VSLASPRPRVHWDRRPRPGSRPLSDRRNAAGRFEAHPNAGTDALGRSPTPRTCSFPRTVPRRGRFVLVPLCWATDARPFGVASWSDLDRHRVHRISRCRSSTTMRLSVRRSDAPLRMVASVRAAVEFERTRFATSPTSLAASARGVTRRTSSRLGDAHPVAVSDGCPLDFTGERGHVVRDLPAAGRAGHRSLVERGTLPAGGVPARTGCRRLRAPMCWRYGVLAGGTTGPLGTLFRVGGVAPQA